MSEVLEKNKCMMEEQKNLMKQDGKISFLKDIQQDYKKDLSFNETLESHWKWNYLF